MRKRRVYAAAVGVWFVFLVVAMSFGALREGLIAPLLGEQAAHVIGTLLFLLVMLAIMWLFVVRIGETERKDLWLIGLMWTAMTVGFEFGFFHFVAGIPWEKLLADYNIFAGRLWVLVLLTTFCGLPLIGWWRHRTCDSHGF